MCSSCITRRLHLVSYDGNDLCGFSFHCVASMLLTRLFLLRRRPFTRLVPNLDPRIWDRLIKTLIDLQSFRQWSSYTCQSNTDSAIRQKLTTLISNETAGLFADYLTTIGHSSTVDKLTMPVLRKYVLQNSLWPD